MTVGERIRQRRIELGLTQEELGKRLGYGKSAVCRVEKEGNNITTDRISKFAKALECSPSYLMGWTANPNQQQLNLYDAIGNKELADDLREKQFKDRFDLEVSAYQMNLSKEEMIILESYRGLKDFEKDMVKRMLNYTTKSQELMEKYRK